MQFDLHLIAHANDFSRQHLRQHPEGDLVMGKLLFGLIGLFEDQSRGEFIEIIAHA